MGQKRLKKCVRNMYTAPNLILHERGRVVVAKNAFPLHRRPLIQKPYHTEQRYNIDDCSKVHMFTTLLSLRTLLVCNLHCKLRIYD